MTLAQSAFKHKKRTHLPSPRGERAKQRLTPTSNLARVRVNVDMNPCHFGTTYSELFLIVVS